MLIKEIKELSSYINMLLKNRGLEYTIYCEIVNDMVLVKNTNGETMFSGEPLKVYNQMHSFRRVVQSYSYK